MAYELIALDMDGTLLDSSKHVLPSSIEAIAEAAAAGKNVAIASGRCPKMVAMYKDVLPDVRYAICCAGAVVYDIAEARVLAERDIDPDIVALAIRTADEEGAYVLEVTAGEGVYMQPDEIEMAPQCGVGVYQQLYWDTSEFVDDAHAVALDPAARISKLNFHFADVAARDRTHARLAEANVVITDCEVSSLEFTCPGIDKGTGLSELARIVGIDVAQAIAVGDADNTCPCCAQPASAWRWATRCPGPSRPPTYRSPTTTTAELPRPFAGIFLPRRLSGLPGTIQREGF